MFSAQDNMSYINTIMHNIRIITKTFNPKPLYIYIVIRG